MIWHIFKKDLKLAWKYAALFAGVELSYVVLLTLAPIKTMENYGAGPSTDAIAGILYFALYVCGALLIARLSHQDAIPGEGQDWLVRPIRRSHLLGAKILGLVLIVHGPMFLLDVFYNAMSGFSFGQALTSAAGHGVSVLLGVSLPLFALCSVGRNLGEAIVAGVVLALGAVLFITVAQAFHWPLNMVSNVTRETGLTWIPTAVGYLAIFVGGSLILALQFFRRKTVLSRALVCVIWTAFGFVTAFFPWKAAFAIERSLAAEKGLGNGITITFDPTIGRMHRIPTRFDENDRALYLPVRVSGLPPDTVLKAELWDATSTNQAGNIKPFSRDKQHDFHVDGPAHLKLGLEPLTGDARENPFNDPAISQQPFQLQVELFMTLLRAVESTEVPMILMGGPRQQNRACRETYSSMSTAFGYEVDPRHSQIEFLCAPVVTQAPCVSLVLKGLPPPWVQTPAMQCFRSYTPFSDRLLSGGDGVKVPAFFRDPSGVLQYEDLDFERLRDVDGMLRWYAPMDHFTRTIVIPNVRLDDWVSATP